MVVTILLLFLLCQTKGDVVRYRCSENESAMSFNPEPRVPGRYTLELCTTNNPNVTQWDIELWYYYKLCQASYRKYSVHSILKGQAINYPVNCTNVCYSVDFDLIYSACYKISSDLKNEEKTIQTNHNMFQVNNNQTLDAYYKNRKMKVLYIPHEKDVTLKWILKVPVPNLVSVCVWNSTESRDTCDSSSYRDACVSSLYTLACSLQLARGCYVAHLVLEPPWYPVLNDYTDSSFEFCVEGLSPPVLDSRAGAATWWVCGGTLGALGAVLAGAGARRVLRQRHYHKRVIEAWKRARESESTRVVVSEPACPAHTILLLYAREGEHGQRAVNALKALLEQTFDGQVIDLYSASTMSLCAAAPGAWLRAALAAPRTKVLLLQSPAAHTLYATHVTEHDLKVSAPLLGRCALYRAPHFGDTLLLLALRLLAEAPLAHHRYHTYYLAQYSGLPGEVLPTLVPYRRYSLPEAAPTLLRDLAADSTDTSDTNDSYVISHTDSDSDSSSLLTQLCVSALEFIQHATDNPNYLTDELILM